MAIEEQGHEGGNIIMLVIRPTRAGSYMVCGDTNHGHGVNTILSIIRPTRAGSYMVCGDTNHGHGRKDVNTILSIIRPTRAGSYMVCGDTNHGHDQQGRKGEKTNNGVTCARILNYLK